MNVILLCSTYFGDESACARVCVSVLHFCMLITQVNLFTLWRILIRFLRHLLSLSLSLYLSLSISPPLSLSPSQPIVNLVLGSHRGPDGGNLIARQGQDSALSMVLRRGSLDVIIKLDRTSFKSMPPPDVWRPPAVGVKVLTSPP